MGDTVQQGNGSKSVGEGPTLENLVKSKQESIPFFQSKGDVYQETSTREGFDLTVTEAMWKGKPMISWNVGRVRIQIEDGLSGYLVDSPEECAWRTVKLLRDSDKLLKMWEAARAPGNGSYCPG